MPLSVEYEQLQVEVLPLSLMERLHLRQWHCQDLTAQIGFAAGSASIENISDGHYPLNGLRPGWLQIVLRVKSLSALAAL
jgi:hypothetical protein